MAAQIRIGTSGFHYKHWRGPFYPVKTPSSKMLDLFAARFDTVELNNSFYRRPSEAALDGWRNSTPADLLFAVKASRFLTHRKGWHVGVGQLNRRGQARSPCPDMITGPRGGMTRLGFNDSTDLFSSLISIAFRQIPRLPVRSTEDQRIAWQGRVVRARASPIYPTVKLPCLTRSSNAR